VVIVREYSEDPVKELPESVEMQVKAPDEPTRNAIIKLVKELIAEVTESPYIFGTWAALLDGVSRLLPISVFRPVLPAEREKAALWKQSALTGAGFVGVRNDISKTWANCGKTTSATLARLQDNYGATISKTEKLEFRKANSDGVAPAMLTTLPGPGEVVLLDCTLEGIHNFFIEVHGGGARYLIQGYQGGYTGVWWVSSCPVDPASASDQLVNPALTDMRMASGADKNIAVGYPEFVEKLALMVRDGYDALNKGYSVWRQLPFNPADHAALSFKGDVVLYVDVYRLRNQQAVLNRTGPLTGALSVQAILSLPVDPPVANSVEVLQALAMLGLQASYSMTEDSQGTVHKFKVTADTQDLQQALRNKLLTRVGTTAVTRLRPADLPVLGQQVEVGYSQFGLEQVVTRTVQ
jgi:hypothetical protein